MGVWIEAAQGGQFGLGPWTLPATLAVFIIRQSTVVWVIYEFEKEVVEGRFPRLLQPLDPVWHHVASHLSERLARLRLPLGLVALFTLYPKLSGCRVWGIFYHLYYGDIGLCLRFVIQYTLPYWPSGQRANAIENFWFCSTCFFGHDRSAGNVPSMCGKWCLDSVPLPNSFPSSSVNWATSGSVRGFLVILGWGLLFFCFEPLAVAAGTEAVLRDGSVGDI